MEYDLCELRDKYYKEDEPAKKTNIFNDYARLLLDKAKFDEILDVCDDFQEFCQTNGDKYAFCCLYLTRGIAFFHKNLNDQAIECNTKSIELAYEIDDKALIATVLNSMAGIYYRQSELRKCKEYLVKSIDLTKESDKKQHLVPTLLNLSRVCLGLSETGEAIQALESSLEWSKKLRIDFYDFTLNLNLAELYFKEKKVDLALSTIDLATKVAEKSKNRLNFVLAQKAKSQFYLESGHSEKALEFLLPLLKLCNEDSYDEVKLLVVELIYKSYSDLKDHKNSYDYLRMFIDLKRKEDERRLETNSKELEQKFDEVMADKEKEIYKLRNIDLKNTIEEINRAYDKLQRTQKEIVKAEKLNVALSTIIKTGKEFNQPLSTLEDSVGNLFNEVQEKELISKSVDRIRQNIERIKNIIVKFRSLKDVNLREYVLGVEMIDIEKGD